MKRTMRATFIILTAIMVMVLAAVTVNAASTKVTSVNIKADKVALKTGASTGLTISCSYSGTAPTSGDFKWTSSNSKVVKVSGGKVTALKKGTATVTVEANGHKDSCKVTVSAIEVKTAYTELNNYRTKKGLKALKKDANLEKIAKIRAEEMAKTGKFSHTRPNGKSSLTMITGNVAKGENIAMGQTSGKEVSKAWYNSKGHRANMLRKNFKKVGIACYTYNGVTYWAQVFSS